MKVHELLNSPEKWTKNASARDVLYHKVSPDDPFAVSWDLSGAINLCYFLTVPTEIKTKDYKDDLARKMRKIIYIIGTPKVNEWQDNPERTFEEIRDIIIKVDI